MGDHGRRRISGDRRIGQGDVRTHAQQIHVSAGNGQGHSRHEHPRARRDSLVDRVPKGDIGKIGALRIHVAHRGEPGFQSPARGGRCFNGAVGLRFVEDRRRHGILRLEQHVRVAVDQPWQQRDRRGQDNRVGRSRRIRGHRFDPLAANHNRYIRHHPPRHRIEHPRRKYNGLAEDRNR
jgi:hypothetical protein